MRVINPYTYNTIYKNDETWDTIVKLTGNKNLSLKPSNRDVILSKSDLDGDIVINPYTGNKMEKYDETWWTILAYFKKDTVNISHKLENLPLISHQVPILDYVKNLDDVYVTRAGVILYTEVNNTLLFGFGLDHIYKEYTDFSGGVKLKDKSPIIAALRELCEETIGLFCNYTVNSVSNSIVMYDKHNLVLFIYISDDINVIKREFDKSKLEYEGKIEVSELVWLTEQELKFLIKTKSRKIYDRLRIFLSKNEEFYYYL